MSNKSLARDMMTALSIDRNPDAVDQYVSADYKQHNPNSPNGAEGLKNFVRSLSPNLKSEIGLIAEEGDIVMIHGRYSGWLENPMIIVDIFRVKDGKVVEHWDVIQEEVPADKTTNGSAMFPALPS